MQNLRVLEEGKCSRNGIISEVLPLLTGYRKNQAEDKGECAVLRKNSETFPERLRRMRRRKGMSQEVLAGLSGLGRETVNKYERGKVEPTRPSLIALANALGVGIDYLSCREEKD